MTIQTQLDRIRAQQTIDDVGETQARLVFHAGVNAFRRWLSPVRSPAADWLGNVETMMIKCRLDGDARTLADLLAVRAAAQLDATVRPGEYDELVRAAGLDLVATSSMSIGAGGRITVGDDDRPAGSYRIVIKGVPVVIREAPIDGELVTDDMLQAVKAVDAMSQRNTGGARYIEVSYGPTPRTSMEMFDTVHDPWQPSTVYSPDLKWHPTPIIEPSTLAATPYPAPTYRPLLPAEAIKRGFISDAQFETIVYALQAVTSYLPGSPAGRHGRRTKGGFIIGDGTGVGKTNEIMGVIMDQWMRGVRRHIIVVERAKHVPHIQEAWGMIGGSPRDIFFQGDTSATEAVPDRDGVIVTTYALLRNDDRYASLVEWANGRKEMTGILAFDEAHNMRNAVEDKHHEGAGLRNQSQQGLSGVRLQGDLPEAGVLYASATMATDVYNLGYAPRLGLWGENAPFNTASDFIAEMHELDEGALEQVCIDLKAAGRYCSRTLSFEGVEYDELVHPLTPIQREMFNGALQQWRDLSAMMKDAVRKAGGNDSTIPGRVTQMRRALVDQLLSSFNVDTLVQDIHREIANGHAPVVQIAYTGEARLARLADGRDYIQVDDYRETDVIDWVMNNFPTGKVRYDKINKVNVPVLDAAGNPVVDPEAVQRRDHAISIAERLAFRHSVLDRLLLEFGPEQIAEVTGRSIRAIPDVRAGSLQGWRIVERSPQAAMDDVQAFHDGRKSILVFSLAAGGTGLGYQAAEKSRNKRRRVHYIMEIGRRAESAVQGLGRTHRSDQVVTPIVRMVTSDIPAQAINTARTLAKIAKLGALSRGSQHAASNAIFEQRVPISGRYAQRGWNITMDEVRDGLFPGMTIANLMAEFGIGEEANLRRLDTAINHLAMMSDNDQRALVDRFTENTNEAIATAIRQGSYNQGMETIRADSIEIVDENRIENANGSTTSYYRLRKRETIDRVPFRRVMAIHAAARAKKSARAAFMRHRVNGRVVLGVLREGPSGIVDLYSPAGSATRMQESLRQEPWKLIENPMDAEALWDLESEMLDTREETDLHILSGSLLYNWNKLPKEGMGLNRCRTDSGQVIMGRVISRRDLRRTLTSMGMQSSHKPIQIAAMLSRVERGARIRIDNGWDIVKGAGGYRLVVPDHEQTGALRNDLTQLGIVANDGPLGFELEMPAGEAVRIIQSIAVGCDISLDGVTTTPVQGAVPVDRAAFATLPLAACK